MLPQRSTTLQLLVLGLVLLLAAAIASARHLRKYPGLVPFNGRVIGGEDVGPEFAPYQASVQSMFGDLMCGAVILNEKWVLTAAHCVYGFNPPYLRIVVGTNRWQIPGAQHFVSEYFVHCNYGEPAYANDIALVQVNASIVMNKLTQPIDLPTRPARDGENVVLTGWGSTSLGSGAPPILQKINLTVISHEKCYAGLNNDPDLHVGHICTYTRAGEGACHGDSGGPLVRNNTIVGVVNWGIPCAVGHPDVFASVYYYLDWIRKTMSQCKSCHCGRSNYGT